MIGGKRFQYIGGHDVSKNLRKKIIALYISMRNKSSNKETVSADISAPDDEDDDNKYGTKTPLSKPARPLRLKTQTKVIENWVKQNKDDFKQITMCNLFLMLRR